MTITKPCKCTHEFQDKQYGKGIRLHNLSENGEKASCTCCGNKITIKNSSKK